jgi:2-methylisocitrate lyase-like PEP mutase family enzyme
VGNLTDLPPVFGLQNVERVIAYSKAGADYVYVEAPQSLEEIETLVSVVPVPIALNIIPGRKTPPFRIEDLETCGVRYLIIPMICLYPAAKAMMQALAELMNGQDFQKIAAMVVSWTEFNGLVGHTDWRELELETLSSIDINKKYGTADLEVITAGEREAASKWR